MTTVKTPEQAGVPASLAQLQQQAGAVALQIVQHRQALDSLEQQLKQLQLLIQHEQLREQAAKNAG